VAVQLPDELLHWEEGGLKVSEKLTVLAHAEAVESKSARRALLDKARFPAFTINKAVSPFHVPASCYFKVHKNLSVHHGSVNKMCKLRSASSLFMKL
jgi:hypothetical protein